MKWQVVFARHALKDAKKLTAAGLREKAQELIEVLGQDPFQNPPPFEKLVGDLEGAYSRRINIQHRLVYPGGHPNSPTCGHPKFPHLSIDSRACCAER